MVVGVSLSACSMVSIGREETEASGESASSSGSSSPTSSAALPQGTQSTSSVTTYPVTEPEGLEWVVLVDDPAQTRAVADRLLGAGEPVISVNTAVGMVAVRTSDEGFEERAAQVDGVSAVATDRDPAWQGPEEDGSGAMSLPAATSVPAVRRATPAPARPSAASAAPKADPLDDRLWGMSLIGAPQAQAAAGDGDEGVTVAVIDSGVDVTHPDLSGVVDVDRSRNFVVDRPEIDGDCEQDSCVDPVEEDPSGHGTHVAGTIAAARNGLGVTGVAPGVRLVNLRAGSDTGMFYLAPTVNAITAAADLDVDVANMSFYVDPWRYACAGGAPGDTPAQAAMQDLTIELVGRALADAHDRGVTLVAAAGNGRGDHGDPGTDTTSPNYGGEARERTIDADDCLSLPTEGEQVIAVSSVGPDRELAEYSDITSDPSSGTLDLAAPGGPATGGPDAVLSTYPAAALRDGGLVDGEGRVTDAGAQMGVERSCPRGTGADDADPSARCGYYQGLVGTSMASPHVAGAAALVISADPDLTPDEVAEVLGETARSQRCPATPSAAGPCVGDRDLNGYFGRGLVDAEAAVDAAEKQAG
ncbi:S8 family serine peptidase [Janibacter melonis]